MPAVLAGVQVEGHHRRGEQVVAGPQLAAPHRDRVAAADVEQAEVDVDGRGHPDAAAAEAPDVAVDRPGLGADCARLRDDVEEPPPLPGRGVDRHHPPAQIAVAVGHAGDHQALRVGGRGGDPLADLPLHAHDQVLPDQLAGLLVEGDQPRVAEPREHQSGPEGHALVHAGRPVRRGASAPRRWRRPAPGCSGRCSGTAGRCAPRRSTATPRPGPARSPTRRRAGRGCRGPDGRPDARGAAVICVSDECRVCPKWPPASGHSPAG